MDILVSYRTCHKWQMTDTLLLFTGYFIAKSKTEINTLSYFFSYLSIPIKLLCLFVIPCSVVMNDSVFSKECYWKEVSKEQNGIYEVKLLLCWPFQYGLSDRSKHEFIIPYKMSFELLFYYIFIHTWQFHTLYSKVHNILVIQGYI